VLPFELLSMLLLAALIGAIVLARREDGESGEPGGEAAVVAIELSDAADRGGSPAEPRERTGRGWSR
jgi:NADH-quinone oxidoreductase subunit J